MEILWGDEIGMRLFGKNATGKTVVSKMNIRESSKRKLRSSKGTTLAETLCAFIIVVLALTMLGNVIVQACNTVKVSENMEKENQAVMENYWKGTVTGAGAAAETKGALKFTDEDGKDISMNVKINEHEYKNADGSYTSAIYDFSEYK